MKTKGKISYQKPELKKEDKMIFMFAPIKILTKVTCRQCSGCHGCR
jgi:hypothetical protein